ncbi:hypothetical protein RB195_006953 [Necator americanus]
MRGLPARGRSRPKKLFRHRQQQPVRLATRNVGTLTGRSRELADSLRKRRVDICRVQDVYVYSLERLQVKKLRRWMQAHLPRHIKSQWRWYHIERVV